MDTRTSQKHNHAPLIHKGNKLHVSEKPHKIEEDVK
jgi:hypothetical protein